MNVSELVEILLTFPPGMKTLCHANGYDSMACPPVQGVEIMNMVLWAGEYHPVDDVPKDWRDGDPVCEIVVIC